MPREHNGWLRFGDYAESRGFEKTSVRDTTDQAYLAAENYINAAIALADPSRRLSDTDIAVFEVEQQRNLDAFERLVTANPRLVDFKAVRRHKDSEKGRFVDVSLWHMLAETEVDVIPLMEILLHKAHLPVDHYFDCLKRESEEDPDPAHLEGTPLVCAIKYGCYQNAEWLLRNGANVRGWHPLLDRLQYHPSILAVIDDQPDKPEFVHLLCERGLTLDSNDLLEALRRGHLKLADAMVEEGVPLFGPTKENPRGNLGSYTKFMVHLGEMDSLKWLFAKGAVPGPTEITEGLYSGHPGPPGSASHEEACKRLYNQTLRDMRHTWLDEAQKWAQGQPSAWNPAKATLHDLQKIVTLGIADEALNPDFWRGAEAHAIALIDSLPEEAETLAIPREALEPFATASPNTQIQGPASAASPDRGGSQRKS